MRTNIVIDDELIREAFRCTEVRTKKELIHLALRELIRIRKKKNLGELAGKLTLREDFDHKELRQTRDCDR